MSKDLFDIDYDVFVSENLEMLTNMYNLIIEKFTTKGELITQEYLLKLGDRIDLLENEGDTRQLYIQSYLFEKLTDYEEINKTISEKTKEFKEKTKVFDDMSNLLSKDNIDNKGFLVRECFTSIVLESILTSSKKRSLAYEKFLQYQEINKDSLSKQLIDYINNLKTQNKTIDSDLLEKLKEWCYKAFETDKFYSRLFLYQKVFKDIKKINEFLLDSSGELTYSLTA